MEIYSPLCQTYSPTDILKEGPGAKTSWEVRDCRTQIPSVKMLFKTNTYRHKHHSTSLIITEQDTIGETKEDNKWHSTQEPRTPKKTVL